MQCVGERKMKDVKVEKTRKRKFHAELGLNF